MTAYESLDDCMIFDFETLSNKPNTGVALSLATLNYSEARFTSDMPYTYLDLVDRCHFIKFDVEGQVKAFGRKIQKDTLEWWGKQNAEAQKVLNPSKADQSITELYSFMVLNKPTNLEKVFTRRNTFDPIFMSSLMECTGNPEPYECWLVKDTISYIEGMTYGSGLKNNFMPEGCEEHFVHHDPRHDIALDVMRMQSVIQAITAF
jgi:hypothetical protein